MKLRPRKTCKNKGCTKVFLQYRTTDKYCSLQCAKDNAPKQKPRKEIKKVSEKRKAESYLYTKKRKTFLALPENKYCPVAKAVFNETIEAREVHHKAGRTGKLYLYVPYWLAVSRKGHNWINANPEEALERGFNLPRTSTNI